MITCRQFTEMYTDYLEGKLPWLPRARLEMHLRLCPFCPAYVDQLEQTIELLETLESPEPSKEVEEAALVAFRARKPAK